MTRFAQLQEWEDTMINQYGYFIHSFEVNREIHNIYTEGIQENFQHPDFQIVLPLNSETASHIFDELVEQIKKGKRFDQEGFYHNIIDGFPLLMVPRQEGQRKVTRIILPDPNGRFYRDKKKGNIYSYQMNTVVNEGYIS